MLTKILFLLILIVTPVYPWSWDTHQNIVEYVYLGLPIEIQMQLNLTKLKDGAIIPDRDFKDHKKHHYPYSMMEAKKWLENDTDISTNLGIASHYITDSYAAPHNIFGEKPFQHAAFEKQVSKYYPKVSCKDYNLKIEQLDGALTTSKDWSIWLKTKNIKIPKNEVDEATKMLFSVFLDKLNTTCGI